MNYNLLTKKMNEFLEKTSAQELVSRFEELGYKFEDTIKYGQRFEHSHIENVCYSKTEKLFLFRERLKQNLIKKYDLEHFEVFFLCNIAVCQQQQLRQHLV